MKAEPQKEHQWLQRLVGNWTYEMSAVMKPGEPPETFRGTEKVRSIGGVWIVAEGRGEMPGGETGEMILTLGFDPRLNKFTGSWVGSMMTYLWVYEGELDATQKVLTLSCDGPALDGTDAIWKFRDIHTLISDNERTLTGNVRGKDGQWSEMMLCTYRRA